MNLKEILEADRRYYQSIPWEAGDSVRVGERVGVVRLVYTNGYTLVQFPDSPIRGGVFNNDSTFKNSEIESLST